MSSALDLDKTYHDVMGKLSKYDRMNSQLAFQIAADSHFLYSVSKEDNCDVPHENLENKFIDIVEQHNISNDEILSEKAKREQYFQERENQSQDIIDNLKQKSETNEQNVKASKNEYKKALEQIDRLTRKEKRLEIILLRGLC